MQNVILTPNQIAKLLDISLDSVIFKITGKQPQPSTSRLSQKYGKTTIPSVQHHRTNQNRKLHVRQQTRCKNDSRHVKQTPQNDCISLRADNYTRKYVAKHKTSIFK